MPVKASMHFWKNVSPLGVPDPVELNPEASSSAERLDLIDASATGCALCPKQSIKLKQTAIVWLDSNVSECIHDQE